MVIAEATKAPPATTRISPEWHPIIKVSIYGYDQGCMYDTNENNNEDLSKGKVWT